MDFNYKKAKECMRPYVDIDGTIAKLSKEKTPNWYLIIVIMDIYNNLESIEQCYRQDKNNKRSNFADVYATAHDEALKMYDRLKRIAPYHNNLCTVLLNNEGLESFPLAYYCDLIESADKDSSRVALNIVNCCTLIYSFNQLPDISVDIKKLYVALLYIKKTSKKINIGVKNIMSAILIKNTSRLSKYKSDVEVVNAIQDLRKIQLECYESLSERLKYILVCLHTKFKKIPLNLRFKIARPIMLLKNKIADYRADKIKQDEEAAQDYYALWYMTLNADLATVNFTRFHMKTKHIQLKSSDTITETWNLAWESLKNDVYLFSANRMLRFNYFMQVFHAGLAF
jgi:hypothetical protein